MASKSFAVFDGDSHVLESPEIWTKYLEPEYRTLGKHALWREEGKHGSYLKVNGKVFRDTMNSNIPRHAIWRPGMTWDQSASSTRLGVIRWPRGHQTLRLACAIWMRWVSIRPFSIRPGLPRASTWLKIRTS